MGPVPVPTDRAVVDDAGRDVSAGPLTRTAQQGPCTIRLPRVLPPLRYSNPSPELYMQSILAPHGQGEAPAAQSLRLSKPWALVSPGPLPQE